MKKYRAKPNRKERLAASCKGGAEIATVSAENAMSLVEFPPPEYLLERARGETNRKLLQDYWETITLLKDEKGFSFREIAEWLKENGVAADYNAVYRIYTKGMSEQQMADVDQQEAEGD